MHNNICMGNGNWEISERMKSIIYMNEPGFGYVVQVRMKLYSSVQTILMCCTKNRPCNESLSHEVGKVAIELINPIYVYIIPVNQKEISYPFDITFSNHSLTLCIYSSTEQTLLNPVLVTRIKGTLKHKSPRLLSPGWNKHL